jgi:hypothetical protein
VARMTFEIQTELEPRRVLDAMVDFSDRRPDLWPALSRKYYNVHELGENWADVTEGSDTMGGIWARERYDWSAEDLTVKSVITESNIFKPGGTFEMRVHPSGSGSRVEFVRDRQGKGKGLIASAMMAVIGRSYLKNYLTKAFNNIARS